MLLTLESVRTTFATENDTSKYTLPPVTLKEIAIEEKKAAKLTPSSAASRPTLLPPNADATPDAYKTLFLARLSYDVNEKDLHREFDMYGPINSIKLVRDKEGKSRGYAFIAYERERDMKAAYKDAEGIKINGRRVMVDVERGRTVKDWKPARLGGGLGGEKRKEKKVEAPAEVVPVMMGGGFGVDLAAEEGLGVVEEGLEAEEEAASAQQRRRWWLRRKRWLLRRPTQSRRVR